MEKKERPDRIQTARQREGDTERRQDASVWRSSRGQNQRRRLRGTEKTQRRALGAGGCGERGHRLKGHQHRRTQTQRQTQRGTGKDAQRRHRYTRGQTRPEAGTRTGPAEALFPPPAPALPPPSRGRRRRRRPWPGQRGLRELLVPPPRGSAAGAARGQTAAPPAQRRGGHS
ncbi:octapeptide-repeat protein T2-like [Dasypus novemcinctus]|uniref:octapeptide-repeat protein T2-like n=1 Tax=Dasypus novemcinctus TaxID=9361 RepID=UPI0039C92BB4